MANIQKNFASVVALGSQNPQILNEDFLKNNKILPSDQPPFDEKTSFICTPPFTSISFGSVEILVEEQRFQIREAGLTNWSESHIFGIAINYYKILKYTPVKTVGLNLNCQIDFENIEEADKFQKLLLPEESKILEIISENNVDIALKLRYPNTDNGQIQLTVDMPGHDTLQRQLNFNYEFNCLLKEGQTDWSVFEAELSNVNKLSDYFTGITKKLLEAI